jgi:hypothetical protein
MDVIALDTKRRQDRMQSDYKKCGSYAAGTLPIVLIFCGGQKTYDNRRKSGVNLVLVPLKFFSFPQNILDS